MQLEARGSRSDKTSLLLKTFWRLKHFWSENFQGKKLLQLVLVSPTIPMLWLAQFYSILLAKIGEIHNLKLYKIGAT